MCPPASGSKYGARVACNDVDDPSVSYEKVAGPTHGNASVQSDGDWSYAPGNNYAGPDAFTFRANDGTADSAPATMNGTDNSSPPIATPRHPARGPNRADA